MRKLAIAASAFSTSIFLGNYLLPETSLPSLGLILALCAIVFFFLLKSGNHRHRLLVVLVCAGLSAGLLWTAWYASVFYTPAQQLDGRTVTLTATVSDWPQEAEYGGYSVVVQADTESFVRLSTILYVDEQGGQLRPGDRISSIVRCTLGDRTFTGQEITYYTAKGIFLRGQAYGELDIQRPAHTPARYWPAIYAKQLKDSINNISPDDVAPLLCALVTGNRDNLTDEFTSSLQRTGLSHTVAVSGMHLAFLASLLSLLLGKGKRSTAVVTIIWAVLFCGVAGNTPSVTRAAVMIVMLQLAPLLGRERDSATALAFALMLLLAWNPFSATHIGLQLSFGAVAGILMVSDPIQSWLLEKLRLQRVGKTRLIRLLQWVPRFWVSTLSATLGAMVLTVPLAALYFGTFSLIAPISNLLTLWAVGLCFFGGLLVGALGIVSLDIAIIMAIPFTALTRYLIWAIDAMGRTPLATLPLDFLYYRAWLVFLYLLLGAAWLIKGKKRVRFPLCAGAVTLGVSVFFTIMTLQAGVMTTIVLDVGQGQSVLLRTNNYLTLVDCGGSITESAGDIAADYIQSMGRNTLDLLVVSHYHSDHANGVSQLLKRVDVSAIALPDVEKDSPLRQEILTQAQALGVEVWFIREDTQIYPGGDQVLTVFAPLGQGIDTNEIGLTVLATAGEFDVLITGDMGAEVELQLLSHAQLPDIELLVVGHHGSQHSTTQALLAVTRPELAAISAGQDNRYGHPAAGTLERLDQDNVQIYRTDLQGTITIRSNDLMNGN